MGGENGSRVKAGEREKGEKMGLGLEVGEREKG